VNFEVLSSLARIRRDDMLREAAVRRLLVIAKQHRPSIRTRTLRVLRAFGYFATTLADAFG